MSKKSQELTYKEFPNGKIGFDKNGVMRFAQKLEETREYTILGNPVQVPFYTTYRWNKNGRLEDFESFTHARNKWLFQNPAAVPPKKSKKENPEVVSS